MGSFNETCMVSGFPIGYGDEVRVIMIKKSRYKESCCLVYPSDLWSPVSMPVRAKYDDYGRAFPIPENQTMAEFALGLLNTVLQPVEQGENKYHDIAVQCLDNWDILLDASHEGRLLLKNSGHPTASPATRVMIREDVWQSMLATSFRKDWRNRSPYTVDRCQESARRYFSNFVNMDTSSPINALIARMNAENGTGDEDGPGFSYNFYNEGYSFIIKNVFFDRIQDKLESGEWGLDHPLFQQIERAFVELAFIQRHFHYIGKMWVPMMTSGQDQQWDECMEFHAKLARVARVQVRERIEDHKQERIADREWKAKLKVKKEKLAIKLAAKEVK